MQRRRAPGRSAAVAVDAVRLHRRRGGRGAGHPPQPGGARPSRAGAPGAGERRDATDRVRLPGSKMGPAVRHCADGDVRPGVAGDGSRVRRRCEGLRDSALPVDRGLHFARGLPRPCRGQRLVPALRRRTGDRLGPRTALARRRLRAPGPHRRHPRAVEAPPGASPGLQGARPRYWTLRSIRAGRWRL